MISNPNPDLEPNCRPNPKTDPNPNPNPNSNPDPNPNPNPHPNPNPGPNPNPNQEAMLQLGERLASQTGGAGTAQVVRARLQSAQLKSDMQA